MMAKGSSEGPLAEFAALREEIDSHWKAQVQLFSLQLTITGAILSFAISRQNLLGLLLIVPYSSYLIGALYVQLEASTLVMGEYIRDILSDRVPGGLQWEAWWRARDRRSERLHGWTLPMLIAFPGSGSLALTW